MFIPLIILTVFIYGTFSFIPIWLTAKNLSRHNDQGDLITQKKNAEIRAKFNTGAKRRR